MKLLDTKAGRRVRGSMTELLNDAIDNLRAVLLWAKYEDENEELGTDEKRERSTIGSLARSASQLTPSRSSGGGGGTPNWSAKVGQIIIGNLMRGEGGRFASARNISRMMTRLDSAGITPDMFTGMQGLLAGDSGGVSAGVMADLRSAGLVNDQGVVQGKANEIINAIKTGDPANLSAVLKPSSGGGGSSGGGSTAADKTEAQAENVEKIREDVIAATKLTSELIDALIAFFDGEDIDDELFNALADLGLLKLDADDNAFMTSSGKSIITNLRQADLRDVLDAYSRGINSMAEGSSSSSDAKKKANAEAVGKVFVERESLTQPQIDTLFDFDDGEIISDTDASNLIDVGLLNISSDGEIFMTTRGQQLITRFEGGDTRGALDALNQSKNDTRNRRLQESTKQRRATAATSLIEDNTITEEQADALIRTWIGVGEGVEQEILSELASMGLVQDGKLVGLGILVMQALDNGLVSLAKQYLASASSSAKMFRGLKQLGGDYFLTWTTNAFIDRDGEIFTTKSIENYLNYTDEKGVEGVYDYWHIPGTEFATIKWQGGVGRFMVEIGQFDNTPVGHAFKALFDKYPDGHPDMAPYGWGCSHEYKYTPTDREDGVYEWFDKQKSTILPLQEASNPFTMSEFGLGVKNMKLSEKQRSSLMKIADEVGMSDLIDVIERVGSERTAILEQSGFQFKAKKVCKTEDGICYPATDYAFVPDANKPSTWKLKIAQGKPGNITVEQLGRAAAAFSEGGFRGNCVELPEDQVGGVKRKVRAEYAKLGVSLNDMPESIKSLKDETMNRKKLAQKMVDLSDAMPEEVREEWDEAAEKVADPESDVPALHRMLIEMLVDLPEETRAQAEELVTALAEIAMPVVEEVIEDEVIEDEVAEEEVVAEEEAVVEDEEEDEEDEEEVIVKSDGETKSAADVAQSVVEELHLDQLSDLLETQTSAIKGMMDAVEELGNKFKSLSERMEGVEAATESVETLTEEVKQAKSDVNDVKQQTDAVISEKARFTPFWANGVHVGSIAREAELDDKQEKSYRKPEVPSAIQGMTSRMLNRD